MGALGKEPETGEIPTAHQEGLDSPRWEVVPEVLGAGVGDRT